ncbi:DarT ssDNA thymidine ADP-ribosyltransferase family protein [Saccharothrix sp. S26]|uniref:DarT ssDNA thymidine ADP-ribosyltransferase family protein n=1 Tax=Saccharothrix sp. S26 TaxID=2907215 RepID=UPI0035AC18A7
MSIPVDLTFEFSLIAPIRSARWSTPEDPHRRSRRAAEFLVLDRMPLELVSHVVTKTIETMTHVRSILPYTDARSYLVEPGFYYYEGGRDHRTEGRSAGRRRRRAGKHRELRRRHGQGTGPAVQE